MRDITLRSTWTEGGRKGGVRTSDVGLVDHHLLSEEHLLGGNFHAQVATGHHDAVGLHQDIVVVVQAFLVLGRGGREGGRSGEKRDECKRDNQPSWSR